MRFLLDIVYLIALIVLSPWLAFRLRDHDGAGTPGQRFGRSFAADRGALWLHGASVGEIALLGPLIASLERAHPDLKLLITSFTPLGISQARSRYPAHTVLPFPFDLSFVTRSVLRRIRPCAIVIVESDLWPNFLRSAVELAVPVIIVNARMSERSLHLHTRARILPSLLASVHAVAAQTAGHAARFRQLGVAESRLSVAGNMKYDMTPQLADGPRREEVRERLGIDADDRVIVAASLHLPEDEAALQSFRALASRFDRLRLVIVPRYPGDGPVMAAHSEAAGFDTVVKSKARPDGAGRIRPGQVLIADTVGELMDFYRAADIAFVGGSLHFRGANKGGHNLMEPAILGIPVLFGAYNASFRETVADLLAADAGIQVDDADELEAAIARLLESPDIRQAMGQRARAVVLARQGATAKIMTLLAPVLPGAQVAGERASDDNAPVHN